MRPKLVSCFVSVESKVERWFLSFKLLFPEISIDNLMTFFLVPRHAFLNLTIIEILDSMLLLHGSILYLLSVYREHFLNVDFKGSIREK